MIVGSDGAGGDAGDEEFGMMTMGVVRTMTNLMMLRMLLKTMAVTVR